MLLTTRYLDQQLATKMLHKKEIECLKAMHPNLKGKIKGIYAKVLLDRESLYKCPLLSFSDQSTFESKKSLILLDFTEVAMLAILVTSEMTRSILPVLFMHVKGHKARTRLIAPWSTKTAMNAVCCDGLLVTVTFSGLAVFKVVSWCV